MIIKDANGNSHNVASKGLAGTALGLGIGGLALPLLNGLFGGGMYNNVACQPCSENTPVNRFELEQSIALSNKDAEIALLKADKYTDQKIVDVYTTIRGEMNALAQEVRGNKATQDAINLQQVAYNSTNAAMIECMKGQIGQLYSLTKLVVPNSSVCPGWGNINVTPATATTAG